MEKVFLAEFSDGARTWFEVCPGDAFSHRDHYVGGRWLDSDDPRLQGASVFWAGRMFHLLRSVFEERGETAPF